MAAVAAVAINLAVLAFDRNDQLRWPADAFFFACGVMPMASLLILVALTGHQVSCGAAGSRHFVLGFEAFGWAMVFAFITCYSIAPSNLRCASLS